MKALKHKNIVNLRQVLTSSSKLYIVMDLVTGGELFTKILNEGKLEENVARRYFQQLVDGIEYCHRRGVCHRDLKPENLLIDETTGELKITDFGLSAMKGASTTEELLHTQCGSPNYCAPEIIARHKQGYNGAKVDAWSCGIILFALLAGFLPFYDENTKVLYRMIQRDDVKFPRKFPPEAKDLVLKLLHKEPERRYTLQDVKKHPWFAVGYDGADPRQGGSSSPPVSRQSRRRRGHNRTRSTDNAPRSRDLKDLQGKKANRPDSDPVASNAAPTASPAVTGASPPLPPQPPVQQKAPVPAPAPRNVPAPPPLPPKRPTVASVPATGVAAAAAITATATAAAAASVSGAVSAASATVASTVASSAVGAAAIVAPPPPRARPSPPVTSTSSVPPVAAVRTAETSQEQVARRTPVAGSPHLNSAGGDTTGNSRNNSLPDVEGDTLFPPPPPFPAPDASSMESMSAVTMPSMSTPQVAAKPKLNAPVAVATGSSSTPVHHVAHAPPPPPGYMPPGYSPAVRSEPLPNSVPMRTPDTKKPGMIVGRTEQNRPLGATGAAMSNKRQTEQGSAEQQHSNRSDTSWQISNESEGSTLSAKSPATLVPTAVPLPFVEQRRMMLNKLSEDPKTMPQPLPDMSRGSAASSWDNMNTPSLIPTVPIQQISNRVVSRPVAAPQPTLQKAFEELPLGPRRSFEEPPMKPKKPFEELPLGPPIPAATAPANGIQKRRVPKSVSSMTPLLCRTLLV